MSELTLRINHLHEIIPHENHGFPYERRLVQGGWFGGRRRNHRPDSYDNIFFVNNTFYFLDFVDFTRVDMATAPTTALHEAFTAKPDLQIASARIHQLVPGSRRLRSLVAGYRQVYEPGSDTELVLKVMNTIASAAPVFNFTPTDDIHGRVAQYEFNPLTIEKRMKGACVIYLKSEHSQDIYGTGDGFLLMEAVSPRDPVASHLSNGNLITIPIVDSLTNDMPGMQTPEVKTVLLIDRRHYRGNEEKLADLYEMTLQRTHLLPDLPKEDGAVLRLATS